MDLSLGELIEGVMLRKSVIELCTRSALIGVGRDTNNSRASRATASEKALRLSMQHWVCYTPIISMIILVYRKLVYIGERPRAPRSLTCLRFLHRHT